MRHLRVSIVSLILLIAGTYSALVAAHGGVSIEKDLCVLQLGPYRMHFTGYQPAQSGAQEFCEDIPLIGRSIIVLDAVDDALRDMPIEVRILRDEHGLGNRAKVPDLGDQAAIAHATLAQLAPNRYPAGSLTLQYDFAAAGRYIGYVKTQPKVGAEIVAVFPFAVGATPYRYWVYGGIVVGAIILAALLFSFRMRSPALQSSEHT